MQNDKIYARKGEIKKLKNKSRVKMCKLGDLFIKEYYFRLKSAQNYCQHAWQQRCAKPPIFPDAKMAVVDDARIIKIYAMVE